MRAALTFVPSRVYVFTFIFEEGWGFGMLYVSFTVKLYAALRQLESPPHSSLRARWMYRLTCSEHTAEFWTPFVSTMDAPIVYTFHAGNYIHSDMFSGCADHGRFHEAELLFTSPSAVQFLYEMWIMSNRSITVFSGLALSLSIYLCVCVRVCVCMCVWNNAGLNSFRRLIYDKSVDSSIAVTCSSCFWFIIIYADYGSLAILIALVMQVRIFSAVSIDLFTYLEMTLTYFRCIRHQHIKLK